MTGIKDIDDELETIRAIGFFDDIEDLIRYVIYEEGYQPFINPIEEIIEKYSIDLEKGFYYSNAVLHLIKIDKYIKVRYRTTRDGLDNIIFIEQVFAYPKKTIKYLP